MFKKLKVFTNEINRIVGPKPIHLHSVGHRGSRPGCGCIDDRRTDGIHIEVDCPVDEKGIHEYQ